MSHWLPRFFITVFLLVFTTNTSPVTEHNAHASTESAIDAALDEKAPLPELEIESIEGTLEQARTISNPAKANRKPGILHAPIYDDQASNGETGLIIDEIEHQPEEPSDY
jgi:hypothetical protein